MTTINKHLNNVNITNAIEACTELDDGGGSKTNECELTADEKKDIFLQQAKQFVSTVTGHKNNKRSRNADFPPESLYAQDIADDDNYAIAERDENVSLYHWEGNYWKKLTRHDGVKAAYKWLKTHAPEAAGAKLAAEAYRTALLDAKLLPAVNSTTTVIPLRNCWIAVEDDGTLKVRTPQRSEGITYEIKATVDASQELYQPKPLPADSMFSKFLHSSLPDDDVRSLVQEYCGCTLLNDTRFQTAIVWLGKGKNGKSVLLNIISALHSKVAAIRLDNMEGFGLVGLVDASLAVSAETPKRNINEQILKACITSDYVTIEGKGSNEFTYRPSAKFIISANSFPKLNDESDGIWRRLMIVEWKKQFTEEDAIKNLDSLIVEKELALVVDWCLEGLQRLLKRGGFQPPTTVTAATKREQEISNTVEQFKDAYFLDIDEEYKLLKEDCYQTYLDYCKVQNYTPLGNIEFWKRVRILFPALDEKKVTVQSEGGVGHTIRKKFINLKFNGDMFVADKLFSGMEVDGE
ncbi:hypothetical protein AWB71_02577 [Caballeronia peredens]|nr:hypothetical protein AWB71_02577 [Caballeronia peredens]